MQLPPKKDAIKIFSDMKLVEVRHLLNFHSFPFVVMNKESHVIGVLDQSIFCYPLTTVKESNETIAGGINTHFYIVDDGVEIPNFVSETVDYIILKRGTDYKIYSALEMKECHYRQQLESVMNINSVLQEELENTRKQNKDLKQILNSSYDEIFVTDEKGNTLFVSESCQKITGLPPEAFLGKNIKELVKKGLINDSVTLKVMEAKATVSAQQAYLNGRTYIATGKPIFNEDGKLHRVITNTRDVTELVELRHKLANAHLEADRKKRNSKESPMVDRLITRSEKMYPIIELIEKVAPIDSSVLLEGESGVGKGIVARIIHDLSPRKKKNFVQVNCGAIPPTLMEAELFGYDSGSFTGAHKQGKPGLVEKADGGTLFLDEVGELSLELQVKLLQLVQDKCFMRVGGTELKKADIRIISATNRKLKELIAANRFREDLYYRLHVVPISIPSLRERKEDIGLLTDYFLEHFNQRYSQFVSLADEARLLLESYEWPGNVRELENLIEQMVVTSNGIVISSQDLPLYLKTERQPSLVKATGIMPLKEAVEELEKQILDYAIKEHRTSRRIAKALKVNQTTVMRKLHKYRLGVTQDGGMGS